MTAFGRALLRWSRSGYDPQEEPDHPPSPEKPRPGAVIRGKPHVYVLAWARNREGGSYTRARCSCGRWAAADPGGNSEAAFALHLRAVRSAR